ncbi:uncharacterized protein TNCV_2755921 [Trichonephila clavipes]|nr:uncharacterized protein TNCV_2755921 [Trichonephila clavipes]
METQSNNKEMITIINFCDTEVDNFILLFPSLHSSCVRWDFSESPLGADKEISSTCQYFLPLFPCYYIPSKDLGHYLGSLFSRKRVIYASEEMTGCILQVPGTAEVDEWYRYRTVACFVTGSSPVPLKTRRVGQGCTLNLSRAETSSRWCGS